MRADDAPIAVFGFNRPDKMQRLLDSLEQCSCSDGVRVYVFIDGPRLLEEVALCDSVESVVRKFGESFLCTEVVRRVENMGVADSIRNGVDHVLKEHDCVIVLEDDLVVAGDFLLYMNRALRNYKNNLSVGSVSGFTLPVSDGQSSGTYIHRRPCSWGWGTWRNRWENCDWSYKPKWGGGWLKLYIQCWPWGQDIVRMFRHNLSGKINSWAIVWTIYHINSQLYAVYPMKSKVKNVGFGAEATHCLGENPFPQVDTFNVDSEHSFNDVVVDQKIVHRFNYFYSNFYKLKCKLRSFIRRLRRI